MKPLALVVFLSIMPLSVFALMSADQAHAISNREKLKRESFEVPAMLKEIDEDIKSAVTYGLSSIAIDVANYTKENIQTVKKLLNDKKYTVEEKASLTGTNYLEVKW